MSKQKGFTLMELLVVIAVIGLLASIILASVNSVRKKARDSRRVSDMRQIRLVIELFYDKYWRYPNQSNDGVSNNGECVGSGVSCGNSNAFETAIAEFMPAVPQDPSHDCPDSSTTCGSATYYYAYDPRHTVNQCPSTAGSVLSFNTSETGAYTCASDNPICPQGGADFNQGDADYVIYWCLKS